VKEALWQRIKIDPLNRKQYGAVSAMLTVSDIPAAVGFYQKALGFVKRGIMNGLNGKPIHAELTLRGTTLMLGPGNAAMGKRTAKTVGASPAGLYLYMERVDKGRRQGDQTLYHQSKARDGHVWG
jgi:uncharacterized glyoxalase superfamily protein PhnB